MADRDCTVAGASAVNRGISKLTKRKQSEKGTMTSFVFICLWVFLLFLFISEDGALLHRTCEERWMKQMIKWFSVIFAYICLAIYSIRCRDITLSDWCISLIMTVSLVCVCFLWAKSGIMLCWKSPCELRRSKDNVSETKRILLNYFLIRWLIL